jgi:hypothetical protein
MLNLQLASNGWIVTIVDERERSYIFTSWASAIEWMTAWMKDNEAYQDRS